MGSEGRSGTTSILLTREVASCLAAPLKIQTGHREGYLRRSDEQTILMGAQQGTPCRARRIPSQRRSWDRRTILVGKIAWPATTLMSWPCPHSLLSISTTTLAMDTRRATHRVPSAEGHPIQMLLLLRTQLYGDRHPIGNPRALTSPPSNLPIIRSLVPHPSRGRPSAIMPTRCNHPLPQVPSALTQNGRIASRSAGGSASLCQRTIPVATLRLCLPLHPHLLLWILGHISPTTRAMSISHSRKALTKAVPSAITLRGRAGLGQVLQMGATCCIRVVLVSMGSQCII